MYLDYSVSASRKEKFLDKAFSRIPLQKYNNIISLSCDRFLYKEIGNTYEKICDQKS